MKGDGYIVIVVDEAEVDAIAKARTAVHVGQTSGEFYCKADDAQHRGVAGELAFSIWSGLPMDREAKRGGDGGKDFEFYVNGRRVTLDVKTSRSPFNLPVKERDLKRTADFLVLAGHVPGIVTLYGWETRGIMTLADIGELGSGTPNFCRPRDELRTMRQLGNILARRTV